jgi:hypothetical protein
LTGAKYDASTEWPDEFDPQVCGVVLIGKPRPILQTFTDPKTGEEIESTTLARWGAGLVYGLLNGLLLGLIMGRQGLLPGLFAGLFGVFLGGVVAWGYAVRHNPLTRRVHDRIARQQHFRRQRILRRQEFPHVPDGALSLAGPPGEPEPTAASLSRAEAPEEDSPLRLMAGVNEASEEEELSVTLVNDCA